MKIYTRTGDTGHTDTLSGERMSKASELIEAVGAVDELNAEIGLALAQANNVNANDIVTALEPTQPELFIVGAQISAAGTTTAENLVEKITVETLERIESQIDFATSKTPPLHAFVMPGGCELAARLHVCRTVCRRTERAAVRLAGLGQPLPEIVITYLNRLSDLLFALARYANVLADQPDVFWHND